MLNLITDPNALIFWSFLTSALTAAIGLGGGVLLLAIMPLYMPFSVVIPIHGAVQLASNASRFATDTKTVRWEYIPRYFLGAMAGVALGDLCLGKVPETYLPLGLGLFILTIIWTPFIKRFGRWLHRLWLVSAIQSFFSLFVGSTGLLSPPVLMDKGLSKDEVIVTHAVHMTIMHSLKVAAFAAAGVSLMQHGALLISMIVTSVLGSWAGGKVRGFIPEKQGAFILKLLLTALALRLMTSTH